MILTGFFRWLGALGLAAFTLIATFLALRFWELPDGMERFMAANAFFEHLGLVGGFLLIAWLDLREQGQGPGQGNLHQSMTSAAGRKDVS